MVADYVMFYNENPDKWPEKMNVPRPFRQI